MKMDIQNRKLLRDILSRSAREACCRKIGAAGVATAKVFLHPMVLLSAGNNVLLWNETSHAGITTSIAATALITGTVIREKFTGHEVGMPYFTLGTINLATSLSILEPIGAHLIKHQHLGNITDVANASASAICLAVWGTGHIWRGILRHRKATGKSDCPQNLSESPMFYTAAADAVMLAKSSLINPIFFVLTPSRRFGTRFSYKSTKKNRKCSAYDKTICTQAYCF